MKVICLTNYWWCHLWGCHCRQTHIARTFTIILKFIIRSHWFDCEEVPLLMHLVLSGTPRSICCTIYRVYTIYYIVWKWWWSSIDELIYMQIFCSFIYTTLLMDKAELFLINVHQCYNEFFFFFFDLNRRCIVWKTVVQSMYGVFIYMCIFVSSSWQITYQSST